MIESGRVSGKSRIPMSIEKLSRRVPEKGRISVSTEIWWNPGKYQENAESLRGSKKLTRQISENGRICVSTKNGRIREITVKR